VFLTFLLRKAGNVFLMESQKMARIEIRFLGESVSVRSVRSQGDSIRSWSELFPGAVDTLHSGLTYEQLRELGEGFHEVPIPR